MLPLSLPLPLLHVVACTHNVTGKRGERLACLIVFYFGEQKALVPACRGTERDLRSRGEESCLASGRPAAGLVATILVSLVVS